MCWRCGPPTPSGPNWCWCRRPQTRLSSCPPNVRLISDFLADAELKRLQNNCGIHLCPSRAEGWGHNILEAMSVEALILTTDAAPMNEHVTTATGILVPAGRSEPRHLGVCHYVDRGALEAAIERPGHASADKARLGMAARQRFLSLGSEFRARAQQLLGPVEALSLAGAAPTTVW